MFVEWMMGLPAGWVSETDTSRTQQLRMLGNAVVPQQASLALELLR
jgi:DNA (cytosine-5)-methyltransferase 1